MPARPVFVLPAGYAGVPFVADSRMVLGSYTYTTYYMYELRPKIKHSFGVSEPGAW